MSVEVVKENYAGGGCGGCGRIKLLNVGTNSPPKLFFQPRSMPPIINNYYNIQPPPPNYSKPYYY